MRAGSSGSRAGAATRSPAATRQGLRPRSSGRSRSGAGPCSPASPSRATAAGEAARLEELRVSAAEDRIDAGLALGRHAELVGELEALVAEHPLRERLRGQLMVALYRSGRQADALEVYQRTRAELVDQLGIEPGPQLQELQRAVLAQDPALAPPGAGRGGAGPRDPQGGHGARRAADARRARTGTPRSPRRARSGCSRRPRRSSSATAACSSPPRPKGVLALFGATVTHEDDALRAVRAACDLHECGRAARASRSGS